MIKYKSHVTICHMLVERKGKLVNDHPTKKSISKMLAKGQITRIEVHCSLIPYRLERGFARDTTFSCKEHNLLQHVLCNGYHVWTALSLCGSLDIDNTWHGIAPHAPEDQAFSLAANLLNNGNVSSEKFRASKRRRCRDYFNLPARLAIA